MPVRSFALLALLVLTACQPTPEPVRIALLAPFEGRYREIGYEALYAARLAVGAEGQPELDLLAVDDGGTTESARERAAALIRDPYVQGAVVLGFEAASPDVLATLDAFPVIVAGQWDARPQAANQFILATAPANRPGARDVVTAAAQPGPVSGGEVLTLPQFTALRSSLADVTIISSGVLPDADFAALYRSSSPFAPEPGLIATLTYDATAMLLDALASSHSQTTSNLATMRYTGLNGVITFADSFWFDAPENRYSYDADGVLIPAPPDE